MEGNIGALCSGGRECRNVPRSNAADEEEKELQYRLMARQAREGAAADMGVEELNAVARTDVMDHALNPLPMRWRMMMD